MSKKSFLMKHKTIRKFVFPLICIVLFPAFVYSIIEQYMKYRDKSFSSLGFCIDDHINTTINIIKKIYCKENENE